VRRPAGVTSLFELPASEPPGSGSCQKPAAGGEGHPDETPHPVPAPADHERVRRPDLV